ncbi:MAG TPA: radical SAM protein [bacterium]|nr:radical SAM protein [bacterium]
MRVALIQTPVWGTREPPLGIVQLAAVLKSQGFETRSFDLNNFLFNNRPEEMKNLWAWEQCSFWYNKSEVARIFRDHLRLIEKFLEQVLAFGPEVAGFSVSSSTILSSCLFASLLKKNRKDIRIVFGGEGFRDADCVKRAFEESPADFIVAGEGEITFAELLRRLDGKKDPSGCKGIYFRRSGGFVHAGVRTERVTLDKLPYMDFSDLRIDDYRDNEHIALMASRGCIWKCAFCSSRSFWEGYRFMSGERIHQEITFHKMCRKGLHVDFQDLVFNGNMERVIEFSKLMVKYPPFDTAYPVQWVANAVITPRLTYDALTLMKRAGCKKLIFGIESGSERVLKKMRKAYKPAVARKVLKDAWKAGIAVTCNFMFGFPGETEEDFNQTLRFVGDVGEYLERVYPSRTYCGIEEYSYFHDHPGKFGIRQPLGHHLYWESEDGANTFPVRLDRCRRFEEFCGKNGIRIDAGVQTSVELDNCFSLGDYYQFKRDFPRALDYFYQYLKEDPRSQAVLERVTDMLKEESLPSETRVRFRRFLQKKKKRKAAV